MDREVSESVANTVHHLWDAAVGEIKLVLAVPFSQLTLAKVAMQCVLNSLCVTQP